MRDAYPRVPAQFRQCDARTDFNEERRLLGAGRLPVVVEPETFPFAGGDTFRHASKVTLSYQIVKIEDSIG